ncbi:flagellar basal-body rod modification protein FlgD [Alkalihalobacillus xiaoxiensis]|uniref:Flagellar basal-body rod modification protein FlgD n=1 Tax=Shouchella xiaoxiensis TaxID=766895 RepID=A0ABS2ST27_9BACI|nr:flagellar hook assembly protein FlgD [Shouchella xiaoxiensis]MBM7837654.1 flagellar basal-body rod modification protein FlgD [Shouchella xiaoxiensis]
MTQIDPSLLLSSQNTQAQPQSNVLGQDAFLKLLLAQIQHQDPTNPLDDREYITQLATFSQLEQLSQLNKTMELLYFEQKSQQLVSLSEIIGKQVSWKQEDNGEQTGRVTGVKYSQAGEMLVEIESKDWIEASRLLQILETPKNNDETGNNS